MTSEGNNWTSAELNEFDRLTWRTGSRDQLERINARLKLAKFVSKHGQEKCDAMFLVLTTRAKGGKKAR